MEEGAASRFDWFRWLAETGRARESFEQWLAEAERASVEQLLGTDKMEEVKAIQTVVSVYRLWKYNLDMAVKGQFEGVLEEEV